MRTFTDLGATLCRSLVAAGLLAAAFGAQAQVQRTFINLSFEEPVLSPNNCWRATSSTEVPGWETTHSSVANGGNCTSPPVVAGPSIELWRGLNGVGARDGSNHAELNSYEPSRIYQSVCLVDGEQVGWRFAHRGRSGPDVADFNIGPNPEGATAIRIVRANTSDTGAGDASMCIAGGSCERSGAIPGVTAGWRDYSGTFVWSGGTGMQTIGFEAVSTTGNNLGAGNLIDAIQVTLQPFVEFTTTAYVTPEGTTVGLPIIRLSGTVPAGGLDIPVSVVGGTAVHGTDYLTPGGGPTGFTVTVPAGVYDMEDFPVELTAVENTIVQDNRTVELRLEPGAGYVVASTSSCGGVANVDTLWTLADNDIDLLATKAVDDAAPVMGTPFEYTVVFANNTARPTLAPFDAHDVTATVEDAVPAGLGFTNWTCQATNGASCPGGAVDGTTSGSGAIAGSAFLPAGDGDAGGRLTYTVVAELDGTQRCAAITNTATIATPSGFDEGDAADPGFVTPVPGGAANNAAQVEVSESCADLAIAKTVSPTAAETGDTVVYTLEVTNDGPLAADGATVTDPGVPDSLDCTALACSATGGATCPDAPTPAQLVGGLVIPVLPVAGAVTLDLTCTVTATGN